MINRQTVIKTLNTLKKNQDNTMLGNFSKSGFNSWKMLISTILSARSKDQTIEFVCKELFKRYPTAKALSKAKQKDVEKFIKKTGFYRNKAKNIINASKMIVKKGEVPDNLEELVELPGVGRKTAGCVLVYAFGKDALPVDVHVHRISNRLGWVDTETPEETEETLKKIVPKKNWKVVNSLFVSHGKIICKPQNPLCSGCPVNKYCKKKNVRKWK